MASEEVKGGFCHFVACIITNQLATGLGALERELLSRSAGNSRLLALLSQSFLLAPSWRVIASGNKGSTSLLSGWTITAPNN